MLEEVESIVLSAILNNHAQYIDKISDEDITTAGYKTILQAARRLQEKDTAIDTVTVGMELQAMNHKGLLTILMQVSDQFLQGVNYETYIEKLKAATTKRKISAGVQYIQDQLKLDNPADIKSNVIDYFSDIPLPGQEQDDSMQTVMMKTHKHLEHKHKNKNDTRSYTGIPELDRFTGGMHNSEMTILAARPSIGKTALGIQIALQMAKKGIAVQCFSREMSQIQLGTRLIANQGMVDGQRMRTGNIRDDDWTKITKAMNELYKLPLFINDEASTVPAIRAVCSEKRHKSLDMILIDYLQLIEPVNRGNNREREVAEISRAVKKMSLEFGIPIIVLSQLNRSNANRRPTIDTLRESGSLEQDWRHYNIS